MSTLHFTRPVTEAELGDWQHVHNTIIPTHVLSLEDVADRSRRHHLEVAHLDGALVFLLPWVRGPSSRMNCP
ncbi:hypothetical protein ACWEQ8_41865 [Streptomyces noursei]